MAPMTYNSSFGAHAVSPSADFPEAKAQITGVQAVARSLTSAYRWGATLAFVAVAILESTPERTNVDGGTYRPHRVLEVSMLRISTNKIFHLRVRVEQI